MDSPTLWYSSENKPQIKPYIHSSENKNKVMNQVCDHPRIRAMPLKSFFSCSGCLEVNTFWDYVQSKYYFWAWLVFLGLLTLLALWSLQRRCNNSRTVSEKDEEIIAERVLNLLKKRTYSDLSCDKLCQSEIREGLLKKRTYSDLSCDKLCQSEIREGLFDSILKRTSEEMKVNAKCKDNDTKIQRLNKNKDNDTKGKESNEHDKVQNENKEETTNVFPCIKHCTNINNNDHQLESTKNFHDIKTCRKLTKDIVIKISNIEEKLKSISLKIESMDDEEEYDKCNLQWVGENCGLQMQKILKIFDDNLNCFDEKIQESIKKADEINRNNHEEILKNNKIVHIIEKDKEIMNPEDECYEPEPLVKNISAVNSQREMSEILRKDVGESRDTISNEIGCDNIQSCQDLNEIDLSKSLLEKISSSLESINENLDVVGKKLESDADHFSSQTKDNELERCKTIRELEKDFERDLKSLFKKYLRDDKKCTKNKASMELINVIQENHETKICKESIMKIVQLTKELENWLTERNKIEKYCKCKDLSLIYENCMHQRENGTKGKSKSWNDEKSKSKVKLENELNEKIRRRLSKEAYAVFQPQLNTKNEQKNTVSNLNNKSIFESKTQVSPHDLANDKQKFSKEKIQKELKKNIESQLNQKQQEEQVTDIKNEIIADFERQKSGSQFLKLKSDIDILLQNIKNKSKSRMNSEVKENNNVRNNHKLEMINELTAKFEKQVSGKTNSKSNVLISNKINEQDQNVDKIKLELKKEIKKRLLDDSSKSLVEIKKDLAEEISERLKDGKGSLKDQIQKEMIKDVFQRIDDDSKMKHQITSDVLKEIEKIEKKEEAEIFKKEIEIEIVEEIENQMNNENFDIKEKIKVEIMNEILNQINDNKDPVKRKKRIKKLVDKFADLLSKLRKKKILQENNSSQIISSPQIILETEEICQQGVETNINGKEKK